LQDHDVEEQRALATLGRTYLMQSEEEEGEGEEERAREQKTSKNWLLCLSH